MPAIRKVEIKQGMTPFDFRLEPGKELKIRFVDTAGKPIPGVYVMIDKWRGGESLYNHRHPNVLNTQIPNQADENGLYRLDLGSRRSRDLRVREEGVRPGTRSP